MKGFLSTLAFVAATLSFGDVSIAADSPKTGALPSAGGDGQATQSRLLTADYGALRFRSGAQDYAAAQSACTNQCEQEFDDCFSTGVTYRVCMNERIQCIKAC